jgi:Family of unknown function (DUF6519)
VKADLTRSTFRPEKHYSSVRLQQGRVQLDADWNEQVDIAAHLEQTTRVDVIGPCGAPEAQAGFRVGVTADASDLTLEPGRLYVDGVLCELEATPIAAGAEATDRLSLESVVADERELHAGEWIRIFDTHDIVSFLTRIDAVDPEQLSVQIAPALEQATVNALAGAKDLAVHRVLTYSTQPHPPAPEPLTPGKYLVFLDQWERLRTALDDREIREIALGGPDTATRAQAVWQVRLHRLGGVDEEFSCAALPDLRAVAERSTGRLRVRTTPGQQATPCEIPPAVGFRGLENQLYRIEIHKGGGVGEATFKLSRENGSVVVPWTGVEGNDTLVVGSLGRDEKLGFKPGDMVELIDDDHELRGEPGDLVKVLSTQNGTIKVDTAVDIGKYGLNKKVRRWDDVGPPRMVEIRTENDGYLKGEEGLEWKFEPGTFATGDYWLVAARTGVGIDWPTDSSRRPLAKAPDGIFHRYCPLAIVPLAEKWEEPVDCVKQFPPLTQIDTGPEPGIHVRAVRAAGRALHNDTEVSLGELRQGIEVICDGAVEPGTVEGKPTVLVTLDLPYPLLTQERSIFGIDGTFATMPLTLDGAAKVEGASFVWHPTRLVAGLLTQNHLFASLAEIGIERQRLLTHLTLKGNFIYAAGRPELNLDAEAFGLLRGGVLDVRLPRSGDGRRGGNLDLWFWLVRDVERRPNRLVVAWLAGAHLPDLPPTADFQFVPKILGLVADRNQLRTRLPATIELDTEAQRNPEEARALATELGLTGRTLRAAVEAPFNSAAELLVAAVHETGVTLELVPLDATEIIQRARAFADAGFHLVIASRETIDKAEESAPGTLPMPQIEL